MTHSYEPPLKKFFTKITVTVIILISCISKGHAQLYSLKCKNYLSQDTIVLDEKNLIQISSITILNLNTNKLITNYHFNDSIQSIILQNPNHLDSLRICFRVFQISNKRSYFLYDSMIRQHPAKPDYANEAFEIKSKPDWWNSPGINYSGNFTRGISTGNQQSLVFNSNLNLQLSGDLGDGFSILGAISDNQIPIQPEGNTRQIQEFDRLFIRISKRNQQLTAGDFEISKPVGYFMNYFKKNKGGILETKHIIKNWQLQTTSAFAISKGKSNRATLKTQNGNQGPYRLFGNNGEQFIILLAGSEKVWIDGELMQRGDDADYSIDYNIAEIRFTPKHIISDQYRIVIEYEYLDQNYTRSLGILQSTAKSEHLQFYFNFYNEQDSRNPAVSSDLDSLDRINLSKSGDDIRLASRSGIRKAGSNYNVNRVYYRERDTIVIIMGSPVSYKYLLFEPNADSTALQVGFSEVSFGKGNYILKQTTANGRVYEWLAPDPITGTLKGNYEPVIPLIAPQQLMMLSAGINYQIKNNFNGGIEFAFSSLDKNRLSNLQDNDNQGIAIKLNTSLPTIKFSDSLIRIKSNLFYEYNHQNFNPINPYRNVEFARDWNLNLQTGSSDHLPRLFINTEIGSYLSSNFQHEQFIRTTGFKGQKNGIDLNWKDSLQLIRLYYDVLKTSEKNENTVFQRPGITFNKTFPRNWNFQLQLAREKNERIFTLEDSLSASSFYFDQIECRIQKLSKNENHSSIFYKHRIDYAPGKEGFNNFSISDEVYLESQSDQKQFGAFNVKLSGKNLKYANNQQNDSLGRLYFLGTLDHQINLWNKFIHLKNYYELQSGVEPRQEFVFEEKRPGEGNFIYIDSNQDGLRQVYEYVYAPEIDTARYVRFQLFNSEYIQIYQSSWNQIIHIDPKNFFKSKSKTAKFLNSFFLESSFRFTSKVAPEAPVETRINPLAFLKNESNLIAYTAFIQQNLFYNRAHPVYEIKTGYQQSAQKILLTSGTDEKKLLNASVNSRITFLKKLDFNLEFNLKNDEKNTPFYSDQNFYIRSYVMHPSVLYRIRTTARVHSGLSYRNSKERISLKEKATFAEFELGSSVYLFKKISLRTELKYISIQFEGKTNSIIEFNMLEGYKNGNNFNWDFQLDYKINSLIQLQFSYNGRKAALSNPLHSAQMQLRANF